jgi:penicillin-binding protein 2
LFTGAGVTEFFSTVRVGRAKRLAVISLGKGRQHDTRELRSRLLLLGGIFLVMLLVLALNLYRLMVVRYEEFLALSVDNQFKDVRVRAPRGLIKDTRGEVLVDARPSFDVFITPAFCQKCVAEVIPRLGGYLGWDDEQRAHAEAMVKATRGPQRYQPLVIQVDLTRDEFDVLNMHQFMLPGVDLEPVPHRSYRAGTALAHVLGYMNEINPDELTKLNGELDLERPPYAMGDYIGRRGVERGYEHVLRGTDGWLKEVVDARGQVMRDEKGVILKRDEVAPTPGANVILSIDARLQAEAERVFPGQAGAVVVMEAKTGFLRAIVSRPSFDPNEMTGRVSPKRLSQLNADPLQPMIFRAGAEHYHPGSTFKVVTLLAALQSGSFTPQTVINCPGGYRLGARTWRCDLESGHGPLQARQALQRSCDVYFYHVADVLGIDAIARVGKSLGLGSVTNLGVAAETPGVMPDSEFHNKYSPGGYTKGMALNTAIGQGDVNVTPLQLAVVYAAVANGGTVLQPQIVRRVESVDGQVLEESQTKIVRQLDISPETRHVLIDALIAVVNEPGGTGFRARLPDVTVAGKTGTAQVMRLGAVRVRAAQLNYLERDHAWFAAFAPAEDPEIVVIVLNEHSGFGGASAAPAAAAILSKYFELKKVDGQAFGKVSPPPTPVTAIIAASDDPLPVPAPYKAIEPAKPSVTELPDAGLAPVAVEPIPTAPDAVTVPPSELEAH